MYCPKEGLKSESDDERISVEAGWFVARITGTSTAQDLQKLSERTGGGDSASTGTAYIYNAA